MTKQHRAVFITNRSNKQGLIEKLLYGDIPQEFGMLKGLKGALFSKLALDLYIEEEVKHDRKILTHHTPQSLQSMSSGERKKALLNYLISSKPEFLILDNPFDNLDSSSRDILKKSLADLASEVIIIQFISRKQDLLPFITDHYRLEEDVITDVDSEASKHRISAPFERHLPEPLTVPNYQKEFLVTLKDVSVCYGNKRVLNNINWTIRPGEFWQIKGKNGSGKTTLLSMITGDNPKGYGQDLTLFGLQKGSGESIWDIKKNIGYFTPAMIDRFRGYHILENMLISGLQDSIGLYIKPTETQLRLAGDWLKFIDMWSYRARYFHELTLGQQRLIMCARAMIKHPLLLILDEPTAGLDDFSAAFFVSLVNKIAAESSTAIVFVSHREEEGLKPRHILTLEMSDKGSTGRITNL